MNTFIALLYTSILCYVGYLTIGPAVLSEFKYQDNLSNPPNLNYKNHVQSKN